MRKLRTGVALGTLLGFLGGSAGAALALPAGDDVFFSIARHTVEIFGLPPLQVELTGPTVVHRQEAVYDPVAPALRIDTEITSMTLTGGGITMIQSPTLPSLGAITGASDGTEDPVGSPNPLFPLSSFFDVFVEIQLPGLTLFNQDPVHMEALIDSLPPIFDPANPLLNFYTATNLPVLLFDVNNPTGLALGQIVFEAIHIPTIPVPSTLLLLLSGGLAALAARGLGRRG